MNGNENSIGLVSVSINTDNELLHRFVLVVKSDIGRRLALAAVAAGVSRVLERLEYS